MEKDSINKFIGNRIKNCRIDNGLTLKDLAVKVALSESNVQRYESGNINIYVSNLVKFAKALNVEPAYLLGWDSSVTISVSEEEQRMLKKYRQLSPAGKATVDAVIDIQYESVKPRLKNEEETS